MSAGDLEEVVVVEEEEEEGAGEAGHQRVEGEVSLW